MAADDEVVISWDPNASTEGVCETCGNATRSARVKKCDDCKAAASAKPAKQDKVPSSARNVKVTVPRVGGTVTPTKAAGTFAKLVILISVAWAWSAVRRYGIPDVDGSLAETLAFTDEEAADIARPLGRLSMSNSASARVVAPIVENDDLIDAGFAIWEWRKRVDKELARYKGNMIADNQRGGTNVDAGQNAQSVSDGAGFDPLAAGYDGGSDARTVV
jgi:hypothetical protein